MEKTYRLWLMAIARTGRGAVSHILHKSGSAEAFFNLSQKEITSLKFLSDSEKERILKKDIELAKNYEKYISDNNIRFITPLDEEFPISLFNIEDPPHGLFCRGKMIDMNGNVLIAMVGARKCTQYGYTCAKTLSRNVAKEGAIIVSGMATGIDSASHEGALEAGMPTIAVLGCGVNVIYPPNNHMLMKRILETGMVISEYPINTEPTKFSFPERNRIISGISSGVAVIEASNRSGSLITARHAAEQGKDLFAVPGNINSTYSSGTNELIKDGAHLVTCAQDITYFYNSQLEYIRSTGKFTYADSNEYYDTNSDNNDIESAILNTLTSDPVTTEQIAESTGLDVSKISAELLIMELSGKVIAYPNGSYSSSIK